MENLLSRGYSSVYTGIDFNTETFTPKSKGKIEQKNKIIEKMRNVCGEPNEKKKERKN